MADRSVPPSPPAEQESPPAMSGPRDAVASSNAWSRTFAALRHPNYRLWFMGQLVSLVGTWMQITAQGFLIFQLTQSTSYLGFIGFANGLPSWLFMLYGGVVADRVAKRNLLLVTQAMMMLLALILAGLAFTEIVQPWHVLVLAVALGTVTAFDAPAGQAFVFELVEREDVTNAIALNAGQFNLATVVGPAIAGLTYAAFGAGWCFALNGVSFVAVIAALMMMRLPHRDLAPRTVSAFTQLREGIRYTLSHPLLRGLMAVPLVTALFGMAYVTLLPAWAVDVLGGDANTYGLLQSARGAGSLFGALMIAALAHYGRRGQWLTIGTVVYPLLLLVFAVTQWLPLAMLVLVGVGWGGVVLFNSANTLVQSHVPDDLRGRVMAIFSLTFFGGMPLGALWAGPLADFIGAPMTLVVSSGILLVFTLLFWLFAPHVRRLT